MFECKLETPEDANVSSTYIKVACLCFIWGEMRGELAHLAFIWQKNDNDIKKSKRCLESFEIMRNVL